MSTKRSKVRIKKKCWADYAIAGTAVFAGASEAEAAITHVDSTTPDSGLPALIDRKEISSYAFDFQWNASTNAGRLGSASGANLRFSHRDFQPPAGSGANAYIFGGTASGATAAFVGFTQPNPPFAPIPFISNLDAGDPLNSSLSFLPENIGILIGISSTPEFSGSGDAYLGFRFNNGTGDGVQFGWARITLAGDSTYTLQEYAYTTEGESITVGQTSVGTPGDFNGDGMVNLADYVAWRDNLGATEDGSVLNGNGNGDVVDTTDYDLWKSSFGSGGTSGALSQGVAVPEQHALGMFALGAIGVVVTRVRRNRTRSLKDS